jgi:hypothetical protein
MLDPLILDVLNHLTHIFRPPIRSQLLDFAPTLSFRPSLVLFESIENR